jgi:hypothetical protein
VKRLVLAFASNPQATWRSFSRSHLRGLGLVGLDGFAVQDLPEQDATDEGVALLALEAKLLRSDRAR